MVVVRGEGVFADAVRRALEHAQSRGVDLSGVEVEVVPDPSIADFGAYAEHLGGLRFRIRYHPRYANDAVLASHEAGHVAYWAWQSKRFGRVQYVPDIDEPLAEAFGAATARKLFGVPVTFKGAPPNLTRILPERTTYITTTVDGKPTVVKVPEWGDYRSRYRAGAFLAPYFYNVSNWSHVFGNFTAAPADVIKTVHEAWRSGAVEVVPGWGPVWRKEPTWRWPDASADETPHSPPQRGTDSAPPADAPTTQADVRKAVVEARPSADVPLPPSAVRPPRYFSSDITHIEIPEWERYIDGRRVLVVLRNWPHLDRETLKDVRRDSVTGVGVVSGGVLRFEHRIPVPRVVDPDAWIEFVDEKTGKVLARLRSHELYKLSDEGAPVTLYWSHVAAAERWSGWERFADRARELDEKLGTWRPSGAAAPAPGNPQPAAGVAAARVVNAPTEYVPPKVPDDVRRRFEDLLSDLKKLGEKVNLKNVDAVHDRFIRLRDKALDIARAHPQLIDETNRVVGDVGSAIRGVSDKLYSALARAAGRDSFWRGDGDVKTPIGTYRYDPATGAFLLTLYDRPVAENVVGFIKDDGTPVVVKKTQNMSEALEEYNKLSKSPTPKQVDTRQVSVQQSGESQHFDSSVTVRDVSTKVPIIGPVVKTADLFLQTRSVHKTSDVQTPLVSVVTKMPVLGPILKTAELYLQTPHSGGSKQSSASAVQTQSPVTQTRQPIQQQIDFLQPLRGAAEFLTNAVKTGASVKLSVLGGAKPSPTGDFEFVQPPHRQQFAENTSQSGDRPFYNRRRGMPTLGGSSGSSQHSDGEFMLQSPRGQQGTDEFVVARPLRPLGGEEVRRTVSAGPHSVVQGTAAQTPSGYRPADYLLYEQTNNNAKERTAPLSIQPPETSQVQESSQKKESAQKRYRGRPVAVAI